MIFSFSTVLGWSLAMAHIECLTCYVRQDIYKPFSAVSAWLRHVTSYWYSYSLGHDEITGATMTSQITWLGHTQHGLPCFISHRSLAVISNWFESARACLRSLALADGAANDSPTLNLIDTGMSLQYCSHLHCRPIVRDGANLSEAPNTPGEAHSEHKVIYHTGPFHLRESSPVGGFGVMCRLCLLFPLVWTKNSS